MARIKPPAVTEGRPEEYDERAGTGIFHRVPPGYKRHPLHRDEYICQVCAAKVHAPKVTKHVEYHRNDDLWADEVEMLREERDEARRERDEMRGEWNMMVEWLQPSVQRLMAYDAAIQARDEANHAPIS